MLDACVGVLQADDPKEAAKGILARAAARGIIAGVQEKLASVREEQPAAKKQPQRKDTKRKSKKDAKQGDVGLPTNPSRILSPISVSDRIIHTCVRCSAQHYRIGPKKNGPQYSTHNFIKYWTIFEIISLLQSPGNSQ